MSGWEFWIDVGGTFTDFVAYDHERKDVKVWKGPSTPGEVAAALEQLPGRKVVYTNGSLAHAERIMELMVGLVDDLGVTLIVASHAHRLMQEAGLELIDHRIEAESARSMHVRVSGAAA